MKLGAHSTPSCHVIAFHAPVGALGVVVFAHLAIAEVLRSLVVLRAASAPAPSRSFAFAQSREFFRASRCCNEITWWRRHRNTRRGFCSRLKAVCRALKAAGFAHLAILQLDCSGVLGRAHATPAHAHVIRHSVQRLRRQQTESCHAPFHPLRWEKAKERDIRVPDLDYQWVDPTVWSP